MSKATIQWRWLLAVVAIVGFTTTAEAQRSVTLRLNTATLPDTLRTTDEVQVRGAIDGAAPFTLPDGNVIDWGDDTTLKPGNAGGDYWDLTFQIPDDSEMKFKFYSQLAEDNSVGGWEDGPDHTLEAGTGDVEMPLHYFVKGPAQPYDWVPWEEKDDTLAVYFRVYMNTVAAVGPGVGYDRTADPTVGVRGDDLGGEGPLDWGSTLVTLTPESDEVAAPGYHIYSGVAYYPETLRGTEQAYKFFVEPGGWEDGADRTFTLPAEGDTTLHWVYFSRSQPVAADPVEALVIFMVDLTPFEDIGIFDRARGDTLWVLGGFNGWGDCMTQSPDNCLMQAVPGEPQFELALPLTMIPGANITYKYFLDFNDEEFEQQFGVAPPSGWEEGHRTGTNRMSEFTGAQELDLGVAYFNDVTSQNIIPAGNSVDVHFSVDMTPAFDNQAQPFEPQNGDSVTIRIADPIWAFTQGVFSDPRGGGDFPLFVDKFILTDDDGDGTYTGTLTIEGPTYSNVTWRFAYGQGNLWTEDNGTGPDAPGRNRTFFVRANPDGSWPSEYTMPHGTFQIVQGPLPWEENPAFTVAIERVGNEVPSQISLGQNYPNPFNPATTFEYTISQSEHVRVRVYDVMGRLVATVVDGVQPASTYRVTFDGSHLASGVYVYQLETPSSVVSKRMVLLK